VFEKLPLYKLKVGKSVDGQDEYVLGHFESDTEAVLVIVRLSDGKKKRIHYSKSVQTRSVDKKFAGSYYIANGECRLRVLWKGGSRDQVAIYVFDKKEILRKIDGDLAVTESLQ
jgi:hypothetical protein